MEWLPMKSNWIHVILESRRFVGAIGFQGLRVIDSIALLRQTQDRSRMTGGPGQSLVELIIVMGLSAILIPVVFAGFITAQEGKPQQQQRAQATNLVRETEEALRSIRERDWTLVASTGTYHPIVSSGSWALASGNETIDGFTRSIVIADVFRNDQGAIVSSGGTRDPSTREVVITVSWTTPRSSSVSSTGYLTRYLDNLTFVHTTEADFSAGITTGTAVVNTNGGEVILGAGGHGDWCRPEDWILGQLDLPKQGVADAIWAIEGNAFVGTGENASGVSFANVAISNTNPPIPSIDGTFDGYKTNGVFGEPNYGYLATDSNQKEVVIIDLTVKDADNKYREAGFFNVPGERNGRSVFVTGNVGYVVAGDKLYTFDLSSKSGSRPILDRDGIRLADTGTRVVVVGTYAYVTIRDDRVEVQIVDVSDPRNLRIVGQVDLTGKDANDIFVNAPGTRAYVVTGKQDDRREFFIIDVSIKTGNRPVIGEYEANGMNPKAVTVVPGNKAIIVGKGAEEYQVIDISNESMPIRCGGLNIDDVKGVNGIASVLEQDGDAYSYIMTGDTDSEFKIIEGGPGGRYASNGTFESSTFDAGYSVAFNRFDVTTIVPVSTSLQFQMAGADAMNGDCAPASFTFVGPDETSATFFATGSAIPLDDDGAGFENPARCFRYKGYFSTSDANQTPVFSDITVNYSP